MLEWYFPWAHIDWVLRVELITWLAVVVLSYWVFWRTVIRRKSWLSGRRNTRR